MKVSGQDADEPDDRNTVCVLGTLRVRKEPCFPGQSLRGKQGKRGRGGYGVRKGRIR